MLDKRNIKNIYELTPMQEGMLFHALYDPHSQAYFEQTHDHLRGNLRVEIFQQTWQRLVERHDVLRTLFAHKNVAQPLQIVLKQREFPFYFEDLRNLNTNEQDYRLSQYKQQDRASLFDLSADPLLRMAVFQLQDQVFDVIWSLHHIILDGWSLNVLQAEFEEIYLALAQGQRPQLSTPVPFGEYIKWLKQRDRLVTTQFWQHYLAEYTRLASLPHKAPQEATFQPQTWRFFVSDDLTQQVKTLLSAHQITLATLIQSLWGVLLGAYGARRDVVFAATVSGRPPEIPGVERMVGLLINAVPVRVRFDHLEHFADLLAHLQTEAAHSKAHHYYSLADIQAAHPLKQDLFDHILVVENFPAQTTLETPSSGLIIERSEHFDHTNYDLTVQVIPAAQLGFHIIYNAVVYDTELIHSLQDKLTALLQWAVQTSGRGFPEVLSAAEQQRYASQRHAQLALAASFTAEPVEAFVQWWGSQFGWDFQVHFAGYQQVFQELLDPHSLLRTTPGLAVVLMRFEDWLRDTIFHTPQQAIAHLDQQYAQWTAAFAGAVFQAPCLVGIFPPAAHLGLSAEVMAHIERLNQNWREFLQAAQVMVLDGTQLAQDYAVTELFDPRQDRVGHLPFSDEFYAALGSALARKLLAGHVQPFKVIAVDCDNTLWDGVCGEVGATGVTVAAERRALQQFLLDKREQGFVLVIVSKNNPADAWAVFEQHPDMLLKREHFVAARINWQAKSQNLRDLAVELNLGLNSFVFLDDSGLECTEVMTNCPQVLTLHLPAEARIVPAFIAHLWGLDKLKITSEDRQRSAMYQAEQQRRVVQAHALSLEDFLRSLEIQVYLGEIGNQHIERVAQLTQRTNQFNLSTRRRSEEEVRALLADPNIWCRGIEVTDKFGRYGLVGVLFAGFSAEALNVDTLLLSCRVLGRQVEYALLGSLREACKACGVKQVRAEYRPTAKNKPILEFLQAAGWHPGESKPSGLEYTLEVTELPPIPEFIQLHSGFPAPLPIDTPSTVHSAPLENIEPSRQPVQAVEWQVTVVNEALLHQAYYVPLRHHTAASLLQLPLEPHQLTAITHFYTPPSTKTEQTLCEIWQEILAVTQVGVDDDFLDLGGHSLKATRIVSRVYKALGVDLTLRDVFEQPTVAQLARLIERRSGHYVSIPHLPAQADYPLLPAQEYVWHFEQAHPGAYNDAGLYLLEGELDIPALEGAYVQVIARHAALRTTFHGRGETASQHLSTSPPSPFIETSWGEGSEWIRQQVWAQVDFQIQFEDANGLEDASRRAAQFARVPFNLAHGPLLRVVVYRLAAQRHALCLVIQHIISDGWSVEVLEDEVLQIYDALRQGREVDLPALSVQHQDCVAWLNNRYALDETRLTWWQNYLVTPSLLARNQFAAVQINNPHHANSDDPLAAEELLLVAVEQLAPLRAFCAARGVSLFTLLCTWVANVLQHLTGYEQWLIGTRLAGREHPDLENQLGFYAMSVGLRIEYAAPQCLEDALDKNARSIAEAFHHALPFELLSRTWGDKTTPLFEVLVVLQAEQTTLETRAAGLRIRAQQEYISAARFPLSVNFRVAPLGLQATIQYNDALFSAQWKNTFITRLREECSAVAH